MLNETEMLSKLERGIDFPPLSISTNRAISVLRETGVDAILDIRYGDETFEFAAQLNSRSTPRAVEDASRQIQQAVEETSYYPIIVVPYLREAQLEELQRQQLSGIDLSGNGVVNIPDRLLVFRTGNPNKYPDSAPAKYAYRGTTSLVARTLLCRTTFESLADIEDEVEQRGGSIALSTISKALKRFESDLIVDRTADEIRLRQADKLLEKLSASYQEAKVTRTFTCSSSEPIEKLVAAVPGRSNLVLTGRSSTDAYAVMGRDEWPVFYTRDIDRLLEAWSSKMEQTTRFIDLELRQTDDPTVYFDARFKEDLPYASPVQVFLELSAGDKREREAAAQVRDFILRELN